MNKYRTCRTCKKKVLKTEGIIAGLSMVHEECWDDFVQGHVKKGRKKRLIAHKKKIKKKSDLTLTQEDCNKYIRTRDAYDGKGMCIYCNRPIEYGNKNTHACHVYSRGARSDLRFDTSNIFGGHGHCNLYADAELNKKFIKNVIKRIGQEGFDKLSERKKQDYSKVNLKKMRREFNSKIKELIK